MAIDFRNEVVIVTGAGGGLGRLYALDVAARGASVVVNDVGADVHGVGTDSTRAQSVVQEILDVGGTAVASSDSVATAQGGAKIVQTALDNFGRVDAVISNAGIIRTQPFSTLDPDDLGDMLDVHLKGGFYVSQPAFRAMKENGGGRFVFIASSSGLFGQEHLAHYGAAKSGLIGLANVIGIEGAELGIRANCVLPFGYSRMVPANREGAEANPVDDRFQASILPEKVVPVVTFLASCECSLNHHIYSAAAGRYARAFIGLTDGWLADGDVTPSAEDIAAHLEEINDVSDFWIPMNIMDEVADIIERRGLADEPSSVGSRPT
jgi:NAD(P)-dependent dehydrogenase (short-subunit alcohol dehydrogenase family)